MRFLFSLAAFVVLPYALFAAVCDGDYSFSADALYFKPMHCPYQYATTIAQGTTTPTTPHSVKADYAWGVRVKGNYLNKCLFASLGYLWYQSKDAGSLDTQDNIVITVPGFLDNPNRVIARLRFEYQNVDLRVGQYLHKDCTYNYYVFANGRWVDIKERHRMNAIAVPNPFRGGFFRQKSEFNGGGFGVGTGGEFQLWGCLDFAGEFNVMGLMGRQKTPESNFIRIETGGTTQFLINFESHCCVIPAAELRLAASYPWECRCLSVVATIGWEAAYYWRALSIAPDTDKGRRVCRDVGFSGPFARLAVRY